MTEQGVTPPKEVVIGDDVWIGRRVMIMPGVIHNRCWCNSHTRCT
ncbi:MAG TPA: hypothetical protein PKK61_01940 [Defluviitaleaceae bacterium]|nr:hypothetical protein [Defluviitaleaceae bacterium]